MMISVDRHLDDLDPITQSVYRYIQDYWGRYGEAPSHREIAAACYIAKGTVSASLKRLCQAKLIRVIRNRPRGIRLVDTSR